MDLENLTTQELKEALAKKEKAEKKKREKELANYETEREKYIDELMKQAVAISTELEAFKQQCHEVFNYQAEKLEQYGMIRGNSKGGFSITSKDGTMRITRLRNTEPYWDERSSKAVELIKEFLYEMVKKRNTKLFEILISFIEKNKDGDLEYSRVMSLIQHEDKYDDPRWKEGLKLIKESFNNRLKGYGYEFKKSVDDSRKWKHIQLNFSSI